MGRHLISLLLPALFLFHPHPMTLEDTTRRHQEWADRLLGRVSEADCDAKLAALTLEQRRRLLTWLEIGRQNPWIAQAVDPPFSVLSFHFCRDVRELTERILHGNWCLGQAFALDEICFINQVNGGDEWLTIKEDTAFESITMQTFNESRERAEERLARTVKSIRKATLWQCRRLEYAEDYTQTDEYRLEPTDAADAAGGLTFRYEHDGHSYEAALELRADDEHRVFRNGICRYIFSFPPDRSHVRLEVTTGVGRPQRAVLRSAHIVDRLGADFWQLPAVEQLQRLLPFLRSSAAPTTSSDR